MSICTIPQGPACLRNQGIGVGLHMLMLLNPSKPPGRFVSLLIFSTVKVNRDLSREHTGHSEHSLPITQEKTLHVDITKMANTEIKSIIFFTAKDGEALYSQQKQDREQTVAQIMNSLLAKFRLKLKKVGKATRPFRYDLKQITYDYTVEVRNRFKGLDLTDRVPDELWMEVLDIVQETGIKTIPKKKKFKNAKWLSEEALQIAVRRREAKSKG